MEDHSYIVRVSLAEDINAPYIWFSNLPCASRDIVKITNVDNSKSLWCEVIAADNNFIERYNGKKRTRKISKDVPFVVLNEWYREQLCIAKNEKAKIKIIGNSCWPPFVRQMCASYKHPDNTVRLAVDLALVSVVLGGLGLILGVISLSG